MSRRSIGWFAVLAAAVATACEPSVPEDRSAPEPEIETPVASSRAPPGDARTLREAQSQAESTSGAAEAYLSDPRYAAADLDRGRILSLACQACHTLGAGEDHRLGPSLFGMFGRRAAQLEGFEYSEALRASGVVWTPEVLEAWLAAPNDFVPGNNMVFAGYRSESDRHDLIAWLLTATAP